MIYYLPVMHDNGFWKVCEALDCPTRVEMLRHLMEIEKTAFPCVSELAEVFTLSEPATSVHLKKLSLAGLVASKRADRRVYYRAFATTSEGELVLNALRKFFSSHPDEERMHAFVAYAHALSHYRRNAIVRCLHREPGLDLKELSVRTDMPPQTVDRLWSDLGRARIVDMDGRVFPPPSDPEATLLNLTVA